jgi:bacillithiol system protein YtxJ
MSWTALTSEHQLETINEESNNQFIVIFKHSTTCNISQMVLSRLERNWKMEFDASVKPYFLNLQEHRAVSNSVASFFGVQHESPQMLIIRNGKPVDVTSHLEINVDNIRKVIAG